MAEQTYTIPRGALISYGEGWLPVALPSLEFTPNAPHSAIGTIHGQTVILHPVTAIQVFGETVAWR